MKIQFVAALLCLLTAACRQFPTAEELAPKSLPLPAAHTRYTQGDLKKLNWLSGFWQNAAGERKIRQGFLFHGDKTLEVMDLDGNSGTASFQLVWHDGRFYFGENREWVVTWIGEKDIRFDPTRPGKMPMTWTRHNENQWYQVRHTPRGDQALLMQRMEDMQP
jgi:hypothetical protein